MKVTNKMSKAFAIVALLAGSTLLPVSANALPNSEGQRLPVETFFKYSEINSLSLSPTGEYLAARVKVGDDAQIAIMDAKTNKILSVLKFASEESEVGSFGWLNDTRVYASMVDKVGPLAQPRGTGFVFAQNVDGKKKTQLLPTPARAGKAANYFGGFNIANKLEDDPKHILVNLFDGSKFGSVYKMNVFNSRLKRVARAAQEGGQLVTDSDGIVRMSIGTKYDEKAGDWVTSIYYRDNNDADWELVDERDRKSGMFRPMSFTKDKKQLFVNTGTSIELFDPATKSMTKVLELPGDATIDRSIFDLDYDNPTMVGVVRQPGYPVKEYIDSKHPDVQLYESLSAAFPNEWTRVAGSTKDNNKLLIAVSSDTRQLTYYMFDRKTNKLTFLLDTAPHRDRNLMAEMKPFSYIARDGLEIRGYLTLPKGNQKNLGLIQIIHGGPYGVRDSWGYHPEAHYFANLGYAVQQINYRGSGGRGSDFQFDAYRQMGMEMQDDLTDAVKWAVEEGIADPERVCIYGASYGGYAAMFGVVKEPDLYKCAVPYVGVYDIAIQKDKSDTRLSKGGKQFLHDAWNAYDPEFVKERSAIYHLDKLKAALLLVHGRMDKRVPVKNYDDLVDKLDEMGYPYESVVEDHEGHGFRDQENVYNLYRKVGKFFDKHIGEETIK